MKKYPYIRSQLGAYLHQDYDLISGTAPDAIFLAVKESELSALLHELELLKLEADDVITEVMEDHNIDIWRHITPRDLLTTMLVLTRLFEEERLMRAGNGDI